MPRLQLFSIFKKSTATASTDSCRLAPEVPLVALHRSLSIQSMDSQLTLVTADGDSEYVRGGPDLRWQIPASNRPRSQFTVGTRRVIVCV
ncbi:hypothetical protein GGF44_002415 [Coemansia sp. RSA 1694]|nr:hypothetical protein GGF44_002415 [Coemansia sp. RSA 1694]